MNKSTNRKNRYSKLRRSPLDGGLLVLLFAEFLVVVAILLAGILGSTAHAEDRLHQSVVLAYSDTGFAERFDDPFGDVFLDEHELNDAWMGMEVQTIDGKNAGYISDAILDEDGIVETVVVTPNEGSALGFAIAVGANFVMLEAEHVTVDMTLNTLAAQQRADEYFETAQLD